MSNQVKQMAQMNSSVYVFSGKAVTLTTLRLQIITRLAGKND